MESRFSIVKGLPLPEERAKGAMGRKGIYPFREMEVGDCLRFSASGTSDPVYRKIYSSAKSHSRRAGGAYEFRFAPVGEGEFGCWKVEPSGSGSVRRRRRSAAEIGAISAEAVRTALESEGTVAGAARMVGVSPRTLVRLAAKLGLGRKH